MAIGEEPEAEAVAAPAVESPILPTCGRLHILTRLGLFAGLFIVALIASWQYHEHAQEDEEHSEALVETAKLPLKKIDTAGNAVESLARGDEALQRHRYAAALSHYEELLAGAAGAAAIVDYRFGLCHEALGQTDRAIAAYRKAISTSAAPALTFATHLAMARCLLQRNEPGQARRLLFPFLFDESRHQNVPEAFVVDARYLTALAWARQSLAPATDRIVDDNPVSFFAVPLEIPFYLDEVGLTAKKGGAAAVAKKPLPLAVKPRTDKQPALILTVDQTGEPAWQLFDLLANVAGLRIDWSAEAKQTLADRSLRLCVRNWPVLDLLEQAADSFELACIAEGDVVRIMDRHELDAKRLTANERALAGRALQAALVADAGHLWAPAACLELGNMEAALGRAGEAAKWYDQLISEAQNSPYVAGAYYNLAKLHVTKQDNVRARQAFFRVVDQSSGHELALRAQVRIGQLYLEQEDIGPAIVQLRRAQTLAPRSAYQPLATLALAAAYLQQACPEQTRALLAGQRLVMQKEPAKATAAFLDAYAQFRLAKATNSTRREASELLSTLWRDQEGDLLGAVGQSLRAQAYRDLGFWDQAERLLRHAAAQTPGPMKPALEYLLGDTLLQQNHGDEATRLFEKLAATPSAFRTRARLQLAQLDLKAKHFQECARKCQELWAEQALPDGAGALLQIWGAALEGAGDFAKAAQCFAGKAPQ